jgi:hypothetical protein
MKTLFMASFVQPELLKPGQDSFPAPFVLPALSLPGVCRQLPTVTVEACDSKSQLRSADIVPESLVEAAALAKNATTNSEATVRFCLSSEIPSLSGTERVFLPVSAIQYLSSVEPELTSHSNSISVYFSHADIRLSIPLLDLVQNTSSFRAVYKFPPLLSEETEESWAQRLVDLMFEAPAEEHVRLDSINLMPSKQAKSCKNHRAELFIWLGAHNADFPRHQPLWLDAHNQVTEGSSTFLSIRNNFPSARFPSLKVPCVRRVQQATAETNVDHDLLFAAWKGQLCDVVNALERGASCSYVTPIYGFSALEKARTLGYHDIVDAIERFGGSHASVQAKTVESSDTES